MTDVASDDARRIELSAAIGSRIREARLAQAATLRDLAGELGVSPATMSALENGRTGISAVRLAEVAALLGVSVDSLLVGGLDNGAAQHAAAPEPVRRTEWRTFEPEPFDQPLEAAVEAFLELGYHGSTMRDIANRAGLSVPGVYYHFASKQEMLVTILEHTMDDLLWRCHSALDEAKDPVSRFKILVECLVLFHSRRREWGFLGRSELRALEGEARIRIRDKRAAVQELVDREIELACAAGEFFAKDPREAGRAVAALCVGISQWYSDDGARSAEEVAVQYVEFALGLVKNRG